MTLIIDWLLIITIIIIIIIIIIIVIVIIIIIIIIIIIKRLIGLKITVVKFAYPKGRSGGFPPYSVSLSSLVDTSCCSQPPNLNLVIA